MEHELLEKRIIEEAEYYINNFSTIRATAKKFGISKSTVHLDLTERLWDISHPLAAQVNLIINKNLEERALRGGIATRNKYLKLRKQV